MKEIMSSLFNQVEIPFFFMALMILANSFMGFLIGQNYELRKSIRKMEGKE